jgi:hypothetical protein
VKEGLTVQKDSTIFSRMAITSEHSGGQSGLSPLRVGDALPKAMGARDMMRAFQISEPTFHRLQREGEFKPFLLPRPIGTKKYSGEKVQAFLNGRK